MMLRYLFVCFLKKHVNEGKGTRTEMAQESNMNPEECWPPAVPPAGLCLVLLKVVCTSSPQSPCSRVRGTHILSGEIQVWDINTSLLCTGTTVPPTQGEISPWERTRSDASLTVLLGNIQMSSWTFLETIPLIRAVREQCKTPCFTHLEGLTLGIRSS